MEKLRLISKSSLFQCSRRTICVNKGFLCDFASDDKIFNGSKLTHVDEKGKAKMVDVSGKVIDLILH